MKPISVWSAHKPLTAEQWYLVMAWCRLHRELIEQCTRDQLGRHVRRRRKNSAGPASPNVWGVKVWHVLEVCRLLNIKLRNG
jgi:hypothetical protein